VKLERALVLNAGGSTLKWSVLSAGGAGERPSGAPAPIAAGTVEWHGADRGQQAEQVGAVLRDAAGAGAVDAAGHRLVHGGGRFHGAVRITPEVRRALGELVELDPLHTPAALAGIDAVAAAAPALPQVAAFDTTFHAGMPEAAALYPLPWEWTERHGLRRYGFHGLSVGYAAGRVAELLGHVPARLLVCHLGNGCSLTAVAAGLSIDTSMGFTPLEGVMMATRAGSVDPGLLLYLQRHRGITLDALADGLEHRSGLAGVSGAGGDLRQVLSAAAGGSRRAALAYDLFLHSLVRMAGAMIAVLGGLDALVFTGGIGEHSAPLRADLAQRLAYAGVRLDPATQELVQAAPAAAHRPPQLPRSLGLEPPPAAARPAAAAAAASAGSDREISPPGAAVRTFVIAAREDLAVLREMVGVLGAGG
jgi:acetate kinase